MRLQPQEFTLPLISSMNMIKKTSIEKIKKLILPIKNKTIDFVIRNNFKNIKAYFFINKIILHNYNFIPTKKNIDKNKNIGN